MKYNLKVGDKVFCYDTFNSGNTVWDNTTVCTILKIEGNYIHIDYEGRTCPHTWTINEVIPYIKACDNYTKKELKEYVSKNIDLIRI